MSASWRAVLVHAQMSVEKAEDALWQRVSEARAAGITVRELADVLGISAATISRRSTAPDRSPRATLDSPAHDDASRPQPQEDH